MTAKLQQEQRRQRSGTNSQECQITPLANPTYGLGDVGVVMSLANRIRLL